MSDIKFNYPQVAHRGHNVSHAKNRTKRNFKYNLHTVTIKVNGVRRKYRVPTKVLRMLKKAGVTTHWKPPKEDE